MKKVYWVLIVLALIAVLSQFKRKPKKRKSMSQLANINNATILSQLNPMVKRAFMDFIEDIKKMGYWVFLTSGYRDFEHQASLKKQDNRNAAPGFSSHNYGTALDLCLVKNGVTYNKNTAPAEWIKTGVPQLAKNKYGMRWGGEFPGYPDTVHFDFNNKYDTKKLYAAAVSKFGDIMKAKGNEITLT